MQFALYGKKMITQNTQSIIISDLFSEENIQTLVEEYVIPFKDISDIRQPIEPRRIIGRYLTYLDDSHAKPVSVMINMLRDQPTVNCDCKEFTLNGKCLHVARVIYSLERNWKREQSLIKEEVTNPSKITELNTAQNNPFVIDEDTTNDVQIISTSNDDSYDYNDEISKHYIIKIANDFDFFSFNKISPKYSNINIKNKKFKIVKKLDNGFKVLYSSGQILQTVSYEIDTNDSLNITCDCGQTSKRGLCQHALETTFYLSNHGGSKLFSPYLKRINEKNKILADFGLTIDDLEAEEFEFDINYANQLFLKNAPKRFVTIRNIYSFKDTLYSTKLYHRNKYSNNTHEIGIVIQLNLESDTNFPIKIGAYTIDKAVKNQEKVAKLNIDTEESLSKLSILNAEDFDILMDFSFLKYRNKIQNGQTSYSYGYLTSNHSSNIEDSYLNYFFNKLEQHWNFFCDYEDFSLLDGKNFSKSNLFPVRLDKSFLYVDLVVEYTPRFFNIKTVFKDAEDQIIIDVDDEKTIYFGRLVKHGSDIYLIKNLELAQFLKSIPEGNLSIPTKFESQILTEVLFPLSEKFGIPLPENMDVKIIEHPMVPTVHLREFQNSLIIEPILHYGDHQFDMINERYHYTSEDNQKYIIKRDKIDEKSFIEYLRSTHNHFRLQNYTPYFTLPFDAVMKNNWFIGFTRDLIAKEIKITGFNELKRFKYNTNKPTWDMNIQSGIDWFDVKIKVQWGDQEASLRDIRKAILNNQDFVVLDDGTIGILPEEWITKYTKLFKFSTEENDGLKISKKQFNIVELLFNQIGEEEIIREIKEKKKKLLHIDNVTTQPIPDMIKAELRPYQETGYQWMQLLDEISWGGCLADDMGLGKTLQAITFLAYVKQKYNSPTSLIVCPTSLIYNWENELKKFAPDLNYHIFYGTERIMDISKFKEYDIIITSYGVVRNDIERLRQFTWEYVMLDESQAIKNPDALSTKSVQLLKTRNRFILSGTPLQNNTYDIFAQFNFLNPGMLGNKDFFKREFANPIDKNGDQEAGMMLRNLIKPFMLRRTKSEVALDLPEKTETVLWCQMDHRQKQLYDEYKEHYRQAILQKIDSQGMAKSGIYILEGLLRLRQICDDPRLIKDENHLTHKGVKIKELMREIEENTGSHKMLIFSQFTEMLALIREEFDKSSMKYCYLDGSTPAHERKNQVDIFQNEEEIKIFLISLKAGGVGLNLTQADYVYLVDPWWNPAVEQQAIDRTHRIGQKNKIFAYKMICKGTVEEKIMQLQEKKLTLSKEIVQEDKAFFKSLSKDDIQFLFS